MLKGKEREAKIKELLDQYELYDEMPQGWSYLHGKPITVGGFYWISDNNSWFKEPRRKLALLKGEEK